MKKSYKLFLSFATLLGVFSLTSCEEKEPTKTDIVYGQLWDESNKLNNFAKNSYGTTKTTYTTLEKLIRDKENFIAVVRGSYPCECWNSFANNCLLPYIKLHNLKVYLIENSIFDKEGRDDFGFNHSEYDHNIAIVNNGEVVEQRMAVSGEDFASDYKTFKSWMDERISVKPKMLYVNKDQLDNLYYGRKNESENDKLTDFTIYFSRSTCGDCSYLNKNFLNDFLGKEDYFADSSLYIIDCDQVGIRYSLDSDQIAVLDQAQWDNFKTEYGLVYSGNNLAGYGTGYVPTLFHIQCNENGLKTGDYIDGADVFFNDSYEKQSDGTFKITESYFTSERSSRPELDYLGSSPIILKGLTYSANPNSNVDDYTYYQNSMFSYHKEITSKFLLHWAGQYLN